MDKDILYSYHQKAKAAGVEAQKLQKLINGYSFYRLGVFIVLICLLIVAIKYESYLTGVLSVLLLGGLFAWLVAKQGQFEFQKTYNENLAIVNLNETESMLHFQNLYNSGIHFEDPKHIYSSDLDIFGKASLFQLINRSATARGNDKLAQWLNAPSAKPQVLLRQDAVKEIALNHEWKLKFQASLWFAKTEDKNQMEKLLDYLKHPLDFPGKNQLSIYCQIAPFILLAAIATAFFVPALQNLWVLVGIINLALVFSKATYIKKTDLIAGKIGEILAQYAGVFQLIEDEQWLAEYLKSASAQINASGSQRMSAHIRDLSKLINQLNYHLNIMVGVALNLFFLWDIRQVIAIENWKQHNRQNLESAFECIGEFEAIISLASLHINYPHWCFPQIADGEGYTLVARRIAHPLIQAAERVENDYDLDDTQKIDIITGSNMAGKSTFLRTLGINTILALAGGPVCASQMKVSVMTIISYMRIRDSLSENTSTFKAELERLKMLLYAVDNHDKVFFLIDEMLRGTNSVDKYKGSKAVIEQLIDKKGVGLVATHDLQIAQLEQKYPQYIRNFYFDIRLVNGEMVFDYKIKHGECKTFNATLLLEQIGIHVTDI